MTVVVLMFVFPPWSDSRGNFEGYSPLYEPFPHTVDIHYSRLLVQWGLVALVTVVSIYTLRDKGDEQKPED